MNDLSDRHGYSVSMFAVMETLRREDAQEEKHRVVIRWLRPRSLRFDTYRSAQAGYDQNPSCLFSQMQMIIKQYHNFREVLLELYTTTVKD